MELINFINLTQFEKELILEWRNSDRVRFNMINSEVISLNNHIKFIESLKSREDKKYFLVKNSSEYIGVIYFTNIEIDSCELGLYSNPNLRGVGSILIEQIIKEAFENLRVKKLKLEVKNSNERAINLYKKFNFREVNRKNSLIYMELEYL